MGRKAKRLYREPWKEMWCRHRQRVRKIKCYVDSRPPSLNLQNFFRLPRMSGDTSGYMTLMRENVGLLVNIGTIMQTTGVVSTFNSRHDMFPSSRNKVIADRMTAIEKDNQKLGRLILAAKSTLNSLPKKSRNAKGDWLHVMRRREMEKFEVPEAILKKYRERRNFEFRLPEEPAAVFNLFRPEIYLEMELVGIRPLGRLYFDLYTEAAPQIVYEFLRACAENNTKMFNIKRVFPYLWMDGEINISEKVVFHEGPDNLEYDSRALSHVQGSGILSIRSLVLDDFKPGPMEFSISFKPSPLFDRNRICFGRLVGGLKVLDILRDYGMQNGRPKTPLRVRSCGHIF